MNPIAWLAILVSSPIVDTVLRRFFFPNVSSELGPDIVKAVFIGLLIVVVSARARLRPGRGFLIALFAFSIGYLFVHRFEESQIWLGFRNSSLSYQWVMADSLLQFLPAALMLAVAFAQGQTIKGLFLTRGNLLASSVIKLFGPNATWVKLTPLFSILFLVISGAFLVVRLHIKSTDILSSKVMIALPYLVLFPILNSIIEEIRYRNVLLATGESVLGGTSVLLMTTTLFGLSHFGSFLGTSGTGGNLLAGLTYALGAALMGWINGRSILETRGILTAWIIHACSDLVIILGYILAT